MLPEVDNIRDVYERQFKEHGDTAQGFGWKDQDGQSKRLQLIATTIGTDSWVAPSKHDVPMTILDVGCGTGELLGKIGDEMGPRWSYTGVDMVPDMIIRAKDKWVDDPKFWSGACPKFITDDFLTVPAFPDTYDYVVSSGAMNFLPEPVQFRYVSKMMLIARRMVCFNVFKQSIQTAQAWAGYFGAKEMQVRVGYVPDDMTVTFWK